jgi:hypothetical protein
VTISPLPLTALRPGKVTKRGPSADAVVPALVVPAVNLAYGVALIFGAVGFPPVGHFSFCQVFGYLLGHAQPRS